MKRALIWLLGELAWLANASGSEEPCWYSTKDRLLSRWGVPAGWDLQILECWGGYRGCTGDICWKCVGTGVYRAVLLRRFLLGRRVFHRPSGDVPLDPRSSVRRGLYIASPQHGAWRAVIRGKIRHRPRPFSAWAAGLLRWVVLPRQALGEFCLPAIRAIRRWRSAPRETVQVVSDSLLSLVHLARGKVVATTGAWHPTLRCPECGRAVFVDVVATDGHVPHEVEFICEQEDSHTFWQTAMRLRVRQEAEVWAKANLRLHRRWPWVNKGDPPATDIPF